MKTFSGQKNDGNGRQTAQGYCATNLVMPGLGSLVGGRKAAGLSQLALCLTGFGLTLGCGVRFFFWALAHWDEFHNPNPNDDTLAPLRDLWQHARWPVLGMFLFGIAWLWALATSRSMLAAAQNENPPRL